MTFGRFCVCTIAFALSAVAALPATVVSVGNPDPHFTPGLQVNDQEALSVSWTATQSYQNVSIYVPLAQGAATYANPVYAYLTTQVGGGTTKANEIANSLTYFTPAADPTVQVFSGLTLAPGTYYLTLWSPIMAGGGWAFATEPNVVTDAGVTLGGNEYAYRYAGLDRVFGEGPWDPPSNLYIPASGFVSLYPNEHLVFDVEAAPVGSAAPEPASAWLLGMAGLAAVTARLYRSRLAGYRLRRGERGTCQGC